MIRKFIAILSLIFLFLETEIKLLLLEIKINKKTNIIRSFYFVAVFVSGILVTIVLLSPVFYLRKNASSITAGQPNNKAQQV